MAYYYSKNNPSTNSNRPYYQNKKTCNNSRNANPRNLNDKNMGLDELIVDGNTVYEIDRECKKHLN